MCTASPCWLNKAKSPVDRIYLRQIQINSQEAAPARAQDRIDRQCSRPGEGLDVPINSVQFDF